MPGPADGGARPASLPGHVRLERVIGSGGSATVWQARDRRDGRPVAVKVLHLGTGPDAAARHARFEREVRALARLDHHPGVLAVRELGLGSDGTAWIVTDLLSGGSLADRVAAATGGLAADEVVRIGAALAGALAHAHDRDVVHGDVTPANVLFGEQDRPVLADFGASVVQAGDGDAGMTPAYAAPERRDGGPPTRAADVYGLGATVWTAATGWPPDREDPGDPGRNAPPRAIEDVLRACCAPAPRDRPSAADVSTLLGRTGRRGPGRGRVAGRGPGRSPGGRRG